ncbi:MAG: ATP-binding protein [Candidatus Marinimicrobia bacterium]|nr:ATP-binding protein [Candidatus Neomarinimicrobiota bacterium]
MIKRDKLIKRTKNALKRSIVVSIMGPRQCGKTTLAKMITKTVDPCHFFDLERPNDVARLENPMLALENLTGLIVLDEIQRMPNLFPILRVLADREDSPAKFLLLGSASPDIIRHTSETLAGRVEFVPMGGFDLDEIGHKMNLLWIRGGFPRSFLSNNLDDSFAWRENFVLTFLERDLGQFGIHVSPQTMQRFWLMLAHSHGQVWNASDLSRSLGISYMTAKRYVDILTGAFMVRQLPPWFENIAKRQIKSPKVFIRDSGIFHYLIKVKTKNDLLAHPKLGTSWEGFVNEQIINLFSERNCYFWRTQAGAELDLLYLNGVDKIGFEAKCTDAVKISKSMRIALQDLNLLHLFVVYPGNDTYQLDEKITAIPISDLLPKLRKMLKI